MTIPVSGPVGWGKAVPASEPQPTSNVTAPGGARASAAVDASRLGPSASGAAAVPHSAPPDSQLRSVAGVPPAVPTPASSAGSAAAGQLYSSAYLSPEASVTAPESQPGNVWESAPQPPDYPEGYGPYQPEPYSQGEQYYPEYGYQPAPHGGAESGYLPAAGYDYAEAYPPEYPHAYPAEEAGRDGSSGGSLRERFARLPRTTVLAAMCVALLLASVTLAAMYIGKSGESSDNADRLHKAQSAVRQRDAKIKQMDASLADAEAKIGSGSDQLSSSQNQLQKAQSDASSAKADLDKANADKQTLTSCLKALTAASAETDPDKRAQLAADSQKTCAPAFALAGIKTS